MSLSFPTRGVLFVLCVTLPVAAHQASAPLYTHVASLPSIVDGQPLRTFVFDPGRDRLYAGSDRGLFFADLAAPEPRLVGPIVRKDILKIEIAADLGRLFFFTDNEIGYVPVAEPGNPVRLAEGVRAWDMAYEPTRQELYVATRDPRVQVFDAKSGERGPDIDLPGWHGLGLEAIPGRVFLGVGGKDGLYAIDAATHTVAPWPVTGRIVTPVYLDADPDGKYLFLTYSRDIVAIDVEKAAVIGRVVTPFSGAIAYDPGTRLLVVTYDDDPPPTRIVAYRVDENGLTPAGRMKSPSLGRRGVEPMHRGFLQSGLHTLLVWKAN